MSSAKVWCQRETDQALAAAIAGATGLSPLTARILAARGIRSPEEAVSFIKPDIGLLHDPFSMRDMDAAVAKLVEALKAGRSITIYGDYDVDGITSTVILMDFLRKITSKIHYFIPDRIQDGYGLRKENLEALRYLGTDLVITVDCGIGSRDEVDAGKSMGLDFIITDHHHPSAMLPEGVPVINPQREGCPYPFKSLAGAGVVFKFLQGLLSICKSEGGELAKQATDFNLDAALEMVAIGTIGDVVPLLGENRILTTLGLEAIRRTKRPGLLALKEISGISGSLVSSSIAYYLAPRLNASGRLGKADRGVHLFLETNPSQAVALARELNEENRYRQEIEQEILVESKNLLAREEMKPFDPIVLTSEQWHPGVIGIVASRLADLHHRPAVLLSGSGEILKGSIRSIPECPLPDILKQCSEHLVTYGGHLLAAGFVIRRDKLEDFRECFSRIASRLIKNSGVHPRLLIDAQVDFRDIRMPFMEEIACLEPFGCGNPYPVFLTRRVQITREPEVFAEKHLRLFVSSSSREMRAVGYKMGHMAGDMWRQAKVDIAFSPELSRSQDRVEIFLNLKDIAVTYQIEHDADHDTDPARIGSQ